VLTRLGSCLDVLIGHGERPLRSSDPQRLASPQERRPARRADVNCQSTCSPEIRRCGVDQKKWYVVPQRNGRGAGTGATLLARTLDVLRDWRALPHARITPRAPTVVREGGARQLWSSDRVNNHFNRPQPLDWRAVASGVVVQEQGQRFPEEAVCVARL